MQAPVRPRALLSVAAAITVVLLLALALALSKSGHHRTGTNGVERRLPVPVPAGARLCQLGESVPPGTARIRFFPQSSEPKVGPFVVTVFSRHGAPLANATVAPRAYAPSQAAVASFTPFRRAAPASIVCIRNTGSTRAGVYAGGVNPAARGLLLADRHPVRPAGLQLRFDYQQADAETWWSFAPTVADRYGLVKATFFGAWTFWLTLALLLALALGSVWYGLRAVAR